MVAKNGRLFRLGTTILTRDDFIISREFAEIPEEDDGDEILSPRPLPVKLTDDGMRKFITQFERKMAQKVTFHLTGQHLGYRDCIREQIRHFARYLRGEE